MTFVASKIFWLFAKPSHVLFLLVVIGAWRSLSAGGRKGRYPLSAGIIGLFAITLLPVPVWLSLPLENRFTRPASLPAEIDGIIGSAARNRPAWPMPATVWP